MAINQIHKDYYVECDECKQAEDLDVVDFEEAVAEVRHMGWRTRKNKNGDWENVCPDCSAPPKATEVDWGPL